MSLVTLLVEFIDREEVTLHSLKVKNIAVFCSGVLKQLYLSQDRILTQYIIANVYSLGYLNNYRVWFFFVKGVLDFCVNLREELCHYSERISASCLQIHIECLVPDEFHYLCLCLACLLDFIIYLLICFGLIAATDNISLFGNDWGLLLFLSYLLTGKFRGAGYIHWRLLDNWQVQDLQIALGEQLLCIFKSSDWSLIIPIAGKYPFKRGSLSFVRMNHLSHKCLKLRTEIPRNATLLTIVTAPKSVSIVFNEHPVPSIKR